MVNQIQYGETYRSLNCRQRSINQQKKDKQEKYRQKKYKLKNCQINRRNTNTNTNINEKKWQQKRDMSNLIYFKYDLQYYMSKSINQIYYYHSNLKNYQMQSSHKKENHYSIIKFKVKCLIWKFKSYENLTRSTTFETRHKFIIFNSLFEVINNNTGMSESTEKQEETRVEENQHLTSQKSIQLVSRLLTDLIETQWGESQSVFDSQEFSNISIEAYLRRIQKYTRFSPQSLIIAVIYLDKYNMAVQDFSLNSHNIHRLLISCLMVAVKFQDDIYFDNCTFSMAGGICTSQLLVFELEIFEKLGFNSYVDLQDYQALLEKLRNVYEE